MTTPPTPPTDNLAAEGGPRSEMSATVDAILREFPMSDDGTGHIADCGYDANDERCDCLTLRTRLADLLAARDRRVRGEALREAAAWVAEGIGYPVQCTMPDYPMPPALWDALVAHVHADAAGKWHGNTLDREDTESWLADEAGRANA